VAASLVVVSALGQKSPHLQYTEDKFVQNMQAAGRNYAAVSELLTKNEYESAKAQLTRAREQLAITITFWRDRKKDDAVKLLRAALDRTDELDGTLSEETVSSSAVLAASQRLDMACQACHERYRIQDAATKAYRVNPDALR